MTRNELNAALAAYEAANSAFEAAMRTYDAARDAYFAIPGKATAEQDAAFDAARAAYATYSVKLTGWHEYEVIPTKPRDYRS